MRRWFLIRLLALSSVAICFYISYFFTNWFTVQRITTLGQDVPEIIFAWEHHLPFIDWTIIPYWSLNLLYGCGFLLCKTDTEVKRYSLQLLTAQVIATMCFLTFPLQISWAKPVELSGFIGFLFKSLTELDLPYNQAPSLHIILSVIVGALYVAKAPWRWLKWGIIVWFVFISVSVLTTFQHH
ncbi:MAG TPA: phosphatase, partial [Pasteurellaceae bacterium]|nr:phosphatase [Pasteurellaceae bacterium]